MDQSFLYVEASEDLPQTCMPVSVKGLLEVYEVVEQTALELYTLLHNDMITLLQPFASLA